MVASGMRPSSASASRTAASGRARNNFFTDPEDLSQEWRRLLQRGCAPLPQPAPLRQLLRTAPIEAFSGDLRRHRLSRAGNRQLNSAMHVIAVCQARDPGPGRDHYRRKLAEAKAPAEARRGLKRQLSNVVYKHLVADQRAAIASTTDLQRALPGIPMINHPRSGVDVLTLHGQVPGERRRQKPGTAAPLTTTAFGTKHWRVTL